MYHCLNPSSQGISGGAAECPGKVLSQHLSLAPDAMAPILCTVLRKLGLVFAALALFSIAGGHWAVLQSVAWVEMLHDYTQRTGSVAVAVEQTFDGAHPCELCREIATAKVKEHKQSPAAPKAKDDAKVKALVPDSPLRPLVLTAAAISFARAVSDCGPGRTEAPPTPPPRRGAFAA